MRILFLSLLSAAALPSAAVEFSSIVEGQTGNLLGAGQGGKWVTGEVAAKAVQAGAKYRLYNLAGPAGNATGSKAVSSGEPCPDVMRVTLQPKAAEDTVAVSCTWNPQPRVPRVADRTQESYVRAVREYLAGGGVKNPEPKIEQIVRVDLDGDGEDEVLISGTRYTGETKARARAGDYSFVLLRRVVQGKVTTQTLVSEYYKKDVEFGAPNTFRLVAVLDLNGDGVLEVVVHSAYYEGASMIVYGCEGQEPQELLVVGCGA